MKQPTLKTLLVNHIIYFDGWTTKGQLHLFAENWGYSPEGAGRELRKAEAEGLIQVSYYKGKRKQTLARYAKIGEAKAIISKPKIVIVENLDGTRTAVMSN